MSEIGDPLPARFLSGRPISPWLLSRRLVPLLGSRWPLLRGYLSAVSGAAGRLVFSLVYFIALANTLSLAEFGLFATASAAGIVLARLLAFGFISAVYRTATVRPRLVGTYTAGFILLSLVSLPVLAAASLGVHRVFFAGALGLPVFALIVAAEALLWRPFELVLIVNNGLGLWGRAATLAIAGFAIRAAAAFLFAFSASRSLDAWALSYCGANGAALLVGVVWFYPRQRLRLRPRLYRRRLPDSVYVAGAEVLFYIQMEMDKLLVLSLGSPRLAGIYAIIMRLVDLTAIPIRTFTMMLVQKIMRAPEFLSRLCWRAGIEGAVFAASTLALLFFAGVLHFFPRALGGTVAEAAPIVGLALFVPALRNLVEYQAELLFARGQTLLRAFNLALLAGLKGVALAFAMQWTLDPAMLVTALNGVFALLYVASALLTYSALKLPAKAI